jgi:hypothetical protein
MLNPYVIIGVLVLWAASLVGAYEKGGKDVHNADLAVTSKIQTQAITASNEANLNDFNDEIQNEYKKQQHDRSHQTHTRAVAAALASDSAASQCKLDPVAYGVLSDSIVASNADAASAPAVVDAPVRTGNGAISGIVGYRLPGTERNKLGTLHMPDEPSKSGGVGQ